MKKILFAVIVGFATFSFAGEPCKTEADVKKTIEDITATSNQLMGLIAKLQLDQLCAKQLLLLDLTQSIYSMEIDPWKKPNEFMSDKIHSLGMAAQGVNYTTLQLNPYCGLEDPTILAGPGIHVIVVKNLVPEKDHKEATQWVLRLQADIKDLQAAFNAK